MPLEDKTIPGVYTIHDPVGADDIPLIIDSPHSGRSYPADFGYSCAHDALEHAEDNEVDLLLSATPEQGATLLTALFPRTYIDVNRAEDDIDTDLLAGPWPGPLNPTPRSYAGNGLIRRLVKPGQPVYNRALPVTEVQKRLDEYYHPYHAALESLLNDAHYRFGQVWHINVHSMPSQPTRVTPGIASLQPDFVLGDRDGTSCDIEFTHTMRDILRNMGYRVAINHPYKGVELVRRSADPARGRHSLQIEINKALYWDEQKNRRNKGFDKTRDALTRMTATLATNIASRLGSIAAD